MDHWKSLSVQSSTVHASFPEGAAKGVQVEAPSLSTTYTVFRDFHRSGRKFTGSHRFTLEGPENTEPPRSLLEAAGQLAQSVEDPWYPVGTRHDISLPSKTSTLSKQELADWVEPIQSVLHEAVAGQGIVLQREYIRLAREEVHYRDSVGRDYTDVRYSGFAEVSLLPEGNHQTHPFHGEIHFSEFSPALLRNFVLEQARLTTGTALARPWVAPSGEFSVLIRGQAVQQIFSYVLRQLRGSGLYSGASGLVLGRPLWDTVPTGDPLNLQALGLLYDSPDTALFDDQGTLLRPHLLVRDGVVEAVLTDPPTAHWLGLPLTGLNNNISVSPGTVTWKELSGQKVLEVHRLRTAEINEMTGQFAAEVELADFHSAQGKSPVFGFSLRGNLQNALAHARYAKEVGSWETYEGPEFILVPSTFVLGGL